MSGNFYDAGDASDAFAYAAGGRYYGQRRQAREVTVVMLCPTDSRPLHISPASVRPEAKHYHMTCPHCDYNVAVDKRTNDISERERAAGVRAPIRLTCPTPAPPPPVVTTWPRLRKRIAAAFAYVPPAQRVNPAPWDDDDDGWVF